MNKLKYSIVKYEKNSDETVNASIIVVDDPQYEKYLFQYTGIVFNLEKNGDVAVGFECSPVYTGDTREFSDEDIDNLNTFSQTLLGQIVEDTIESYQAQEDANNE